MGHSAYSLKDKVCLRSKAYLILLCLLSLTQCKDKSETPAGKVYIKKDKNGYTLYKNNVPFLIKGAAGFTYLKELKQAGGNTIRTYDTTNLGPILDSAQKYQISVIVGLHIPNSKNLDVFYKNEIQKQKQYAAFRNLVERYKSHPALLVWCLGNEVDFPYSPFFGAFYDHFNNLVEMIKEVDRDHPVTTTIIKRKQVLSVVWRVKSLDFISINIFGKLTHLEYDLKSFEWLWEGPFLISEWGPNGYWETEYTAWQAPIENTSTKKADIIAERFSSLSKMTSDSNRRCIGSLIFYWGEKQEKTPTWFSMFTENGKKTDAVNIMSKFWSGKKQWQDGPPLNHMVVNEKGAHENIMLLPGSENSAKISFSAKFTDTYQYKWDIFPEELEIRHSKNKLMKPLEGFIKNENSSEISFKAPDKEGAYRILVKVIDSKGNCATTNTPFYVLGNELQK